jgi:hypothetical protein
LHHVRDGDEHLYLAWADLMLGKPADPEFLREESDSAILLLPARTADGPRLPYRDFVFQYPSLALLPIALPSLITTDRILYPYAFGVFAGLAALVVAIAGWRIESILGGVEKRYLWLSAGALFLVGVTLETRLDVFTTALIAVALWAAVTGRWTLAGAMLGAGTALKIVAGAPVSDAATSSVSANNPCVGFAPLAAPADDEQPTSASIRRTL